MCLYVYICNYGCIPLVITLSPHPTHIASPSLGTVDQLELSKLVIHRRLATLFIVEMLVDDPVLDIVDIIHRREVFRRQEERGAESHVRLFTTLPIAMDKQFTSCVTPSL